MPLSFQVEILTHDELVYEGRATSLVAPGELGYFGVLKNHAPFISGLRPGKMTIKKDDGSVAVFNSCGKGFFEVEKNRATILLDEYRQGEE
jgi:F-type H+-transporting ATPase subunit epsilon